MQNRKLKAQDVRTSQSERAKTTLFASESECIAGRYAERYLNRNAMYAKIAIARKQLGLEDDIYRELLQNKFKKSSAKDLSDNELTRLLRYFTECGVQFVSKKNKKRSNISVNPHSRPDWIDITPGMPFYSQKKQILAIWKKLGYSMSSLDTRVQREFNCYSFVWLQEEKAIIALLTDLQKRERAFDIKVKNENKRITA